MKDLVWADAVSRNARINCEFWIDPFGVQLYLSEQLGSEQAAQVHSEQRMEQLRKADALILYLEEYRWGFSAEEVALVRSRCRLVQETSPVVTWVDDRQVTAHRGLWECHDR